MVQYTQNVSQDSNFTHNSFFNPAPRWDDLCLFGWLVVLTRGGPIKSRPGDDLLISRLSTTAFKIKALHHRKLNNIPSWFRSVWRVFRPALSLEAAVLPVLVELWIWDCVTLWWLWWCNRQCKSCREVGLSMLSNQTQSGWKRGRRWYICASHHRCWADRENRDVGGGWREAAHRRIRKEKPSESSTDYCPRTPSIYDSKQKSVHPLVCPRFANTVAYLDRQTQ